MKTPLRTIGIAGAALCALWTVFAAASPVPSPSWSVRIAESFLRQHPDSIVYPDEAKSKKWNYEQGLMLEAFYRTWKHTGDEKYRDYLRTNLDHYVGTDGSIRTYSQTDFNLDNVAPGKALLRAYGIWREEKYRRAAEILRTQLSKQPRNAEGGFWHKKIYPHQMWLDGLYMAEPFYTLYAVTFHDTAALDDIAQQFLLIRRHARDRETGLYFHGWDESRQQRWADATTGCSPNLWGRSLGWLSMALVDVLEIFPTTHPRYPELKEMYQDLMKNILAQRDESSKTWYQVIDKQGMPGNYLEASGSCMFTYAMAEGALKGYLDASYATAAEESFDGIVRQFVTTDATGTIFLHDVCQVAGLGGKPYRDGSFEYYVGEPRRTNDFKGYGPFLLAAVAVEQGQANSTAAMPVVKKRTVVGLDEYFNNEWKKRKDGTLFRYHYTWDDTLDSGFSVLASIFRRVGADIDTLQRAPTKEKLDRLNIYIIVDPDTPKETATPKYIGPTDIDVIERWVRGGGVLVLMGNDKGNAEFEHLNRLAGRFGIRFNEDLHQDVVNNQYDSGRIVSLPSYEIFTGVHHLFIKQFCSLSVSPPAREILNSRDVTVMAESHVGNGMVFAVGDPWLYNEYIDNRRLPPGYENFTAAEGLVRWLVRNARIPE